MLAKIRDMNTEIEKLRDETDKLSTTKTESKIHVDELANEVRKLESQIARAKEDIASNESEIKGYAEKVRALDADLALSKRDNNAIQLEVSSLNTQIAELQRLEHNLARIQEENKNKSKLLYKLEKELRDKKLSYTNLENET
mmetsp:Transcript_881/g.1830  ORF Transcript_881/g.1830 Transcript_881/m.1830 type:complete len:142 (-) Transcript_881:964-1389(-)